MIEYQDIQGVSQSRKIVNYTNAFFTGRLCFGLLIYLPKYVMCKALHFLEGHLN